MQFRTFRRIRKIFLIGLIIAFLFTLLLFLNEQRAVDPIKREPADLGFVLRKETLSGADYDMLFSETGLSQSCVDALWHRADKNELILSEQKRFYDTPDFDCYILTLLTKSEKIIDKQNAAVFYDLRPGDVLLTKSTHTLFYRHGHSALVLDEDTLLEAAAIGEPIQKTKADNWGMYPTYIQLRIKEDVAQNINMSTDELGKAVADYAESTYGNASYSLFTGAFGHGAESGEAQCAHLIADPYAHFGITASSRKFPATPYSLIKSGAFEIIQYRGFDLSKIPGND